MIVQCNCRPCKKMTYLRLYLWIDLTDNIMCLIYKCVLCMSACKLVSECVCMCAWVRVSLWVSVCAWVRVSLWVCVCVHVNLWVSVCVCACKLVSECVGHPVIRSYPFTNIFDLPFLATTAEFRGSYWFLSGILKALGFGRSNRMGL